MATEKITAKRANGKPVEADYDFGDDLDAMVEKFGPEIVFNHARGSLTVALQGFMRTRLDKGKSPKEIQADVTDWSPGARKQGKSPAEKLRETLDKMSPEERAAILKEYRQKQRSQDAA